MKLFPITFLAALGISAGVAQVPSATVPSVDSASALKIDLSNPDLSVQSGHLQMGGKNPQGVEINANSRYLTLGGKPWFPAFAEFHFTRYPREEWEQEVLKMKAGGIDVVSTYVFWIYHEEEEGKWNWSGNHDLRAFLELCKKHGLFSVVRLGPWGHGEVRNGAFPDWLLQKCGKQVRRDAEPYLSYAKKLYEQTAQQLKGLLWKDGGSVIGAQIENELTSNPKHLATLKTMAREQGIDVPLYTVTGWMRARFPENEMLPVFAGYPDSFWSRSNTTWARESRANYFFSENRDDSTVGADLAKPGANSATQAMQRYPYGTVELGGGMQVSYRRRPVIEADDIAALALVKIGSGSNMQGYYMYHGGANGMGKLSTLQESRATGYPNDMPVISYDFQAALGQYGQRRGSYDALRVQHLFLRDFGGDLAPMPIGLPEKVPGNIDDRETLRWTGRSDGTRGYLFINNYQRIETLPDHQRVQLEVTLKDHATLKVPAEPITIPAQTYMVWPFNMELGGVRLKYATAQPLCRVGDTTVFFALPGIAPEFVFDSETLADETQARIVGKEFPQLVSIRSRSGAVAKILLLSKEQANQAYKANLWGMERLFLSKAGLVFEGDKLRLQSRLPAEFSVAVYPPAERLKQVNGAGTSRGEGVWERFTGEISAQDIRVNWKQTKPAQAAAPVKLDAKGVPLPPEDAAYESAGQWQANVAEGALDRVHKLFLRIDYAGDVGRAYVGDRLIDDDFYFGRVWEIELRRFAPDVLTKGVTFKILPLRKDAPVYIPADRLPQFGENGEALAVRAITVEPEYEIQVHQAEL